MTVLFFYCVTVVILLCISESALGNELVILSGQCICPGYTIIFECTVVDEGSGGTTVWQGTALDCESKNKEMHSNCVARVSQRGASEGCNNGAVVGRSVRVQGTHYVSRLHVTLTPEMISETVECAVDNGVSTTVVGSLSIMPTSALEKAFIIRADLVLRQVTFNWTMSVSSVSSDSVCPAVNYHIMASNCGSCPTDTTLTTATCTDLPIDASVCTFAIQSMVCTNIAGRISDPVVVNVNEMKDDSRYIGTLVAVIILAVVLILCVTFFSIVFVITLKAKARIQAQLGANNNAVATEKASVESHAQAPHEVNMDINENVAYGIPVHFIHEKGN